jgi:POT family proton-dependent oligopeptide transporter
MEHVPDGLGPVEIKSGEGRNRKTVLTWDPETKVLTALEEINVRARTEFLAAAAQPDFKTAVDKVYLESSQFRVSVWWLIAFYLVLTMGELCLSPVGLSLVTKLAPSKHVGLCMGGWFLATAIAEKLAQVFGAYWGKMPPVQYFFIFVVMCAVGALLMALLVRRLKRMMHGIK